jgi:amidase
VLHVNRARSAFISALLGVLFATAAAQSPSRPPFDLEEATMADLQQRMQTGAETSRSLVEKYLARIDAIDRGGPALHSVIETNPDALTIADRLDAERKARGPRGPLHGIPILIKDNIATADRMMTTAGSLALEGVKPPRDAFIVERLREAGAVILGKTNLSEWANFRSTRSTSGWSARGGLTRNPYALDRSPIGSSSGSGAATAANLCSAAVGTETDGSVIAPSSAQALVGIKPTVGLVSRSGIIPISHSQDTAGPMARTVADAVALLGAMMGRDPEDPATTDSVTKGRRDYTPFLDSNGLQGARIGVVRAKMFGAHLRADGLAEAAILAMRDKGATIVDPANIASLGKFDATELEVMLYEFKADLQKYLTWLGSASPVQSLKDVIAFNDAHKKEEMPFFGQEQMIQAEQKGPLTSPAYRAALAKNHRFARTLGIDAVMGKYRLDALVAPSMIPPWPIDLVNGDSVPFAAFSAASPTSIAAVAGYPHITVPAGFVHGLPVGISFFGRAWSEPTLIKIAYAYEQATRHRRPPTFAPSADLSR